MLEAPQPLPDPGHPHLAHPGVNHPAGAVRMRVLLSPW